MIPNLPDLKLIFADASEEDGTVPPMAKPFCSSLKGSNGPILKFSEIFAPHPDLKIKLKRQKY